MFSIRAQWSTRDHGNMLIDINGDFAAKNRDHIDREYCDQYWIVAAIVFRDATSTMRASLELHFTPVAVPVLQIAMAGFYPVGRF